MKNLKEIVQEVKHSKLPVYVYVLYKPDGTPFYVGKGGFNRVANHEKEAKRLGQWRGMNPHKLNTIRKIWREGKEVLYSIDSWYDNANLANEREVELIAIIGRVNKGEGTLTNITAGGEGSVDLPLDVRRRMAESASKTLQKYCLDNPDFIENLQEEKNRWIAECPEEYKEAEKKRLEICASSEVRGQVSKTLKEYFSDPTIREAMSKAVAEHYVNNPESVEKARQNAIKNKSHEAIIKWLDECSEECRAKLDRQSEYLKDWHQQNPEAVKEMIESRNKVLKSEEHRKKMAYRFNTYAQNNPEAAQTRTDKMKKALVDKKVLRSECMKLIQQKLINLGEIAHKPLTNWEMRLWKKSGLLEKHFPDMPGQYDPIENWGSFRERLCA